MPRSRSVVAALILLFAQAAAGDCLTPSWELIPTLPPAGSFRPTMVVDDFDGDGIADTILVRSHVTGDTATFQRGRGNGFFAAPVDIYIATQAGIHGPRGLYHALARDLNRDGKLDLLLLENLTRLVYLPGNGDGTFADPLFSPMKIGGVFAIAELTGDDIDDVVAFHYDTGFGVVIFAGTATGTFAEWTRIPLPASPNAIATGDLDGDGANDIVAGYGEPSNLALLFGNDDGTFDPAVPLVNDGVNGDSWAVTIELADLENDGDLDIVAENFFDLLAVHRNRGGRIFDEVTIYPVPQNFSSVKHQIHSAVADVTGDGKLDLVATTGDMVVTRRGLGDGTFDTPHFDLFPASGLNTESIDTTDFDGDGRVDVIIGQNHHGPRTLRNRCGDANVFLTANPPSPFLPGQSVTVQVAGYADDFLQPPPVDATGTVSILEGPTVLATGTLSNGQVTLTVPGLTPGAHKLVARYSGDDQYQPAESARIIVRVTSGPAVSPPPPPRRRAVR